MTNMKIKELSVTQKEALFDTLKKRFDGNMHRHKDVKWKEVQNRLEKNSGKLWSLNQMEVTGGEPDVLSNYKDSGEIIFYDCSGESSKERRSVCYDPEALASRKEHKPRNSAIGMAVEMGIELLNEDQYRYLQQFGNFDTKTSSWIATPFAIRALGGSIFGDCRYGQVFIYHNGAESYYASRGFRGYLRIS